MSIETERLIIRNYSEGDLEALAALLGHPETMAFWPRPLARDEAAAWLARNIERRETGIYGRRAVILKASGARKIVAALRQQGWLDRAGLEAATGLARNTVAYHLKRLAAALLTFFLALWSRITAARAAPRLLPAG